MCHYKISYNLIYTTGKDEEHTTPATYLSTCQVDRASVSGSNSVVVGWGLQLQQLQKIIMIKYELVHQLPLIMNGT